jgi:hypothetical protein
MTLTLVVTDQVDGEEAAARTREVLQRGIEVSRELVAVLDPDDLLRLSCSALAAALESRVDSGL